MNRLRIRYNEVKSQEGTAGFKPEYTNQLAVEVEYVREALQNERYGIVRQVDSGRGQGRIRDAGNEGVQNRRSEGTQDVGRRAEGITK